MHHSMTGFASGQGATGSYSWTWDLRSVNAKGLDLRLRVPDWVPGLEPDLKARLAKAVARGNVTLNLRVSREETATGLTVNLAMLDNVLTALTQVEDRAMSMGVTLAPSKAADLLALRGVLDTASPDDETEALAKALKADFEGLVTAFTAMRAHEGQALTALLHGHFDRIEALVTEAAGVLDSRRDAMKETLVAQLRRVMEADQQMDDQRLTQELALIAVKADVTEELDRLTAHVAAARDLLAGDGPAGRKLDFLAQEFNREANTLCSKSQNADLTAVGLELKAVIEQMREQVQNLE
ncbi:YicC/YloC family endoribonuclease [Pseudooceanicola onchidii]|uniref:YicC/YloC family endoribonuclease n=1 Tax=Pseudooceanicola onchidii TaxID=2562279 RepID=UPI0010AA48E6|nr:YicC/YloC family endoribonuclease [Pseudooceanicola onchidii]